MYELSKGMLDNQETKNKLAKLGFDQESDQQEFLSKRVGEMWQRHMGEFKNMDRLKNILDKSYSMKIKFYALCSMGWNLEYRLSSH